MCDAAGIGFPPSLVFFFFFGRLLFFFFFYSFLPPMRTANPLDFESRGGYGCSEVSGGSRQFFLNRALSTGWPGPKVTQQADGRSMGSKIFPHRHRKDKIPASSVFGTFQNKGQNVRAR